MQVWEKIKELFQMRYVEEPFYFVTTAAVTNVGLRRENNEDNYYYKHKCLPQIHNEEQAVDTWDFDTGYTHVLAVFDGMGGESAGDLASYTGACSFCDHVKRWEKTLDLPSPSEMSDVLNQISQLVYKRGREHHYRLICSTASMLFLCNNEVVITDLGDSPMFLLRDNQWSRISLPHTDENLLRQQGIQRKPGLTQFLGIDSNEMRLEPYVHRMEIQEGDQFLICSDGLTDMVTETEIQEVLFQSDTVQEKVQKLLGKALSYGGKDNVTIILCEIGEEIR